MIFVITGSDGSGKSTACKQTKEILESKYGKGAVSLVPIWDTVANSGIFVSKESAAQYLNDLDGFTRTLLIFHGVSRSIDLAYRNNAEIILVDGYWYKYAATEIGMGVDPEWVISLGEKLPRPDLTLCLDIEPHQAVLRKKRISQYEQGNCRRNSHSKEGKNEGSAVERFVRFQTEIAPAWKRIEHQFGPWAHLSALLDPASIATLVSEKISARVSRQSFKESPEELKGISYQEVVADVAS